VLWGYRGCLIGEGRGTEEGLRPAPETGYGCCICASFTSCHCPPLLTSTFRARMDPSWTSPVTLTGCPTMSANAVEKVAMVRSFLSDVRRAAGAPLFMHS